MDLGALASAALPSFIASAVEFVEATTIILAVGVTRGWRAPLYGAIAAALTLAIIIAVLGVTIVTVVPEHALKAFVGAVLLEGTEVAFIVIAFGAGGAAALNAAIVGAIAAGLLVIALGVALRAPLTMVPENWMKFGVGAILSAFGVFWFAEGLGAEWPGDALAIPMVLAVFLAASWIAARMLAAIVPHGAEVAAKRV